MKRQGKPVGFVVNKTILYILLILLAALCIMPFLLMMVNATRSGVEISHSFSFVPGKSLGANYRQLSDYFNIYRGMLNSVIVALPATFLTAYFSAMTAYGLAFYKFKTNKLIFVSILIFMMIPGQLSLIGFYQLCTKLHMVNSYLPLILPAIASPGTVYFLRQYAMNNYLLPMIILNKKEKFTLPVLITTLNAATDLQSNQGAIYLAVAISVIPILIVFCIFSRQIIGSIASGAVKE